MSAPGPMPPQRHGPTRTADSLKTSAFVGNGLDQALEQRLSRPDADSYRDPVAWSYATATNREALFGDIGTLWGRGARVRLTLGPACPRIASVLFDLRRAGDPEPRALPPLVVTVEAECVTAIALGVPSEGEALDIAAWRPLPVFDGLAEYLIGHLDRILGTP